MSRIENIEYPFPETINVPMKKDASPYSIHFFRYRYSETSDSRHMFWLCANSKNTYAYIFPIRIYKDTAEFVESHLEKTMHAFQEHIAYPAFELLCQNNSKYAKENIVELDKVSIADYYEKEMYALLFDENECKKANISSVRDIVPHLFYHGFCYLKDAHAYKQVDIVENSEYDIIAKRLDIPPTKENEKEQQADKRSLATGGKLIIQPISQDLRNQAYIEELFGDLLIQKLHSVMRFHLLYQVIELIINKIGVETHQKSFKEHIDKIEQIDNDLSYYQDIRELYHIGTQISKKKPKSELDIIKILIDRAKILNSKEAYKNLTTNNILPDKFKSSDISDCIYKLRNIIVHGLYAKTDKIKSDINKVISSFTKLVIDIVIQYTLPPPTSDAKTKENNKSK